ncbi:MAG: type I-B CRISPR-associated protein Cas7/Csh2 [Candidatus Methanofastidiosia archaeon]
MSQIVKNRSEVLFLYDVTYANPNGDPMEDNRPRIDEETGINMVTDVRLKRTIRDYLLDLIEQGDERLKEQDIFIKEVRDSEGYLYDAKKRAKDFLKETGKFSEMKEAIQKDVCSKCIDVRLFGCVIPLELGKEKKGNKKEGEKGSITLIGPVQFRFGRSLHRVDIKFIKGTGAFASDYEKKKSMQFTFREEYVLPYSLIAFYGVINENSAKNTGLTEEDVNLLLEGTWNGTKNLITRSKFGQMPRLIIKATYGKPNFYIGDLDRMVGCVANKELEDEKIRSISELRLDITKLKKSLEKHKYEIEKIEFQVDSELKFMLDGKEVKADILGETIQETVGSQVIMKQLNF